MKRSTNQPEPEQGYDSAKRNPVRVFDFLPFAPSIFSNGFSVPLVHHFPGLARWEILA
ncbi:hypothetical protein [Larkinella harenae]